MGTEACRFHFFWTELKAYTNECLLFSGQTERLEFRFGSIAGENAIPLFEMATSLVRPPAENRRQYVAPTLHS